MRTEQTQINYLQKAERMAYMMDIEEQAVKAAKSLWQADENEARLAQFRQEAENLLNELMEHRNTLVNMHSEAVHQSARLARNKNLCIGAKEAYERNKHHEEYLNRALWNLAEAIEYLHEYLHPSQEGNASQEPADLPFASNFGVVAQTPKESLLKALLRKQGEMMRSEYLQWVLPGAEAEKIRQMTATDCWSLLEKAIKSEGFDVEERSDVEGLWLSYSQGTFNTVLETVKEWFLN